MRQSIRLALLQEGCSGILVLLDSDDDCPKDLGPQLQHWAQDEAGDVPCAVVMAHREFEAWLLGGNALPRPEDVRGAKEVLRRHLGLQTYSEVADQAGLTARFDLASAYRSCRSFRRMVRAFGLVASEAGASLGDWPPSSWI